MLFSCHKMHITPATFSRNQINFASGTVCLDRWRFPSRSPRCSTVIIRANRRFITKKDNRVFFTGHFFNRWKFFCHPFSYKRAILLIRATFWMLRRKVKLFQQTAVRYFTQPYVELAPNLLANHTPGPKSKFKFQFPGGFADDGLVNIFQLAARQFRRPARSFFSSQGLNTALSIFGKPFVTSCSGKAKCFNHNFRAFTCFKSLYRTNANFFQRLAVYFTSVKLIHGCTYNICTLINGLIDNNII